MHLSYLVIVSDFQILRFEMVSIPVHLCLQAPGNALKSQSSAGLCARENLPGTWDFAGPGRGLDCPPLGTS